VVLPNGLRALLLENHSAPSVVCDGYLRGGTVMDPLERPGLASFSADILERGTRSHDFASLSETLESIGAEAGVGAQRHTIGFDAKCLSEDLPLVLGLLTEMLAEPSFPPEQVEIVRGQILTGLRQRMDDTRYRAARAFRELAYGPDHPYGRPSEGTPESITRLTATDLGEFHASIASPRGGAVVLVGDFDTTDAVELLSRTLGSWEPVEPASGWPEQEVAGPAPPAQVITRETVIMAGKTQADLVIGHPSIPRRHPDWYPATVANTALGVFGLMGRLGENVRDKRGLAYYAFSRLTGGLGPGAWLAMAGVNPANVDEAAEAILFEMRRLRDEPIPADELADVKAYLSGSLPLRLETNEGLAQTVSDMVLYELGLDYLAAYPDLIGSVTAEAVQRAANEHLRPETAYVIVAGPESARS
jgi:zinc protease